MAKRQILAGSTSVTIYVKLLDSSSTVGAGKTGLAYNTSGIKIYYARYRGSATAITPVTQTVTGAYSSGGFVEVSTNMPGIYRLDIPDAALASGVPSVVISISGMTGVVEQEVEIELTATDNQDANAGGMAYITDSRTQSGIAATNSNRIP